MLGRGIDQILRYPSDPTIHEGYMRSAEGYVEIAERVNGHIPRHVPDVWGEANDMLRTTTPPVEAVVINLETSTTRSDDYWRGKGINYRMEPANVGPVLSALGVDCCVLANNHILDWGYSGMQDTLDTLHAAGVATAGAGLNRSAAAKPAIINLNAGRRVLVYSLASMTSGVPPDWAARARKPGVLLLEGDDGVSLAEIQAAVLEHKHAGDIAIASVHWGGNWGYNIPSERRRAAHALIDRAGFDVVHGHSSHHPIGAEVHNRRLILYGCGDFINDYEVRAHVPAAAVHAALLAGWPAGPTTSPQSF
jgi:poly-gamma-glutamate synthesis protein (capsule biosynthesis protein)